MSTPTETVTTEQLARLYQGRNEANKRMSQALRGKDRMLIDLATASATIYNRTYALAVRQYKRQQKSASRAAAKDRP